MKPAGKSSQNILDSQPSGNWLYDYEPTFDIFNHGVARMRTAPGTDTHDNYGANS